MKTALSIPALKCELNQRQDVEHLSLIFFVITPRDWAINDQAANTFTINEASTGIHVRIHNAIADLYAAVQSQMSVSAHFTSKQILPSSFAEQCAIASSRQIHLSQQTRHVDPMLG